METTDDIKAKPRKRVKSTSSVSSIMTTDSSIQTGSKAKKIQRVENLSSQQKLNQTVPLISKSVKKLNVNETIITKCCVCNEVTVNKKKYTIKCGECNNSYHLKCLDEPVKQYKGYVWQCKNCLSDDSSQSSNEDSNEEHETVNSSKIQTSCNIEKNDSSESMVS